PLPVPGLAEVFRLLFFLGPERLWRGALRAGDLLAARRTGVSGAASSSPPRGRADPLRARVAMLTNVARTRCRSQHLDGVSRSGRKHVVVPVRVAEAAPLVERAGRIVARLDLEQDPPRAARRAPRAAPAAASHRNAERGWRGWWGAWDKWWAYAPRGSGAMG